MCSIALTRDNNFIVSGSGDNTVRIWNVKNRVEEAVLPGHTSEVASVAITSDKKYILSFSDVDKSVRMWNIEKKQQEAILRDRVGGIQWISKYPEIEDYLNRLG